MRRSDPLAAGRSILGTAASQFLAGGACRAATSPSAWSGRNGPPRTAAAPLYAALLVAARRVPPHGATAPWNLMRCARTLPAWLISVSPPCNTPRYEENPRDRRPRADAAQRPDDFGNGGFQRPRRRERTPGAGTGPARKARSNPVRRDDAGA